jgi:hypothetical protein
MESGFRPPQASNPVAADGRINQYALVAYIDGALGEFLFRLRQEIVPGCTLRSHISILPPRQLDHPETVYSFLASQCRDRSAFDVTLDEIQVFQTTQVIFIDIGAGKANLHEMHDSLNAGVLSYPEPYPYHPHITLAQQISEAEHPAALQLCHSRWNEYKGPKSFPVETLTFVQNTSNCGWLDLAETRLAMVATRR